MAGDHCFKSDGEWFFLCFMDNPQNIAVAAILFEYCT